MRTFFTADTHFGHARIIELCDRPFDTVESMNRSMIDHINEDVGPENRLVVLGDLCLGKLEESLQCLSALEVGELVLVPGNHDRWSLAYPHRGDDVDDKREKFRAKYQDAWPGALVMRDSAPSQWTFFDLTGDWVSFGSPLSRAIFSHYPDAGDSHGDDRYATLRPSPERPIIHGHVHTEWHVRPGRYNVGVDVNGFRPVPQERLEDWIAAE